MGSFSRNRLLIIVCDLDIMRVALLPDEAQTPLIIDADAVLTHSVVFKCFQSVARRPQIQQVGCRIQNLQLPQGDPLNVRRKPARASAFPNLCRLRGFERSNYSRCNTA